MCCTLQHTCNTLLHIFVWRDSGMIHVTWLNLQCILLRSYTTHSHVEYDRDIRVTWLDHDICDVTHSSIHDSFLNPFPWGLLLTRLIQKCCITSPLVWRHHSWCMFIGKVVFICLRVSVNLVYKFQGKPGTTTVKHDFNSNGLKFHRWSPWVSILSWLNLKANKDSFSYECGMTQLPIHYLEPLASMTTAYLCYDSFTCVTWLNHDACGITQLPTYCLEPPASTTCIPMLSLLHMCDVTQLWCVR